MTQRRLDSVANWSLGILATVFGTVITVASEVLAGFLTPLRVGSTYLPVSWVVVVLGVFVGLAVARYGSGSGAAIVLPVIGWFYVLLRLTTSGPAGDLVVGATWVGYGMLLIGVSAMLVAIYVVTVRPSGLGRSGGGPFGPGYLGASRKPAQRPGGRR
jgi:hypothetical protein